VTSESPLIKKLPSIEPGGLIAILGGGQLGRMTAMAARTMGYRVRVMDPEAKCPASFVVDDTIVGKWDDVDAAKKLARGADAVTLEIEQIGVDALSEVARLAPLRPGVEPIRIIQDKTLQKAWLAENGFPVGPFRVIRNEDELHHAVQILAGSVYLKIGRGGYDGRGQVRIGIDALLNRKIVTEAWTSIGEKPSVAEQALDLVSEISVMAARSPAGEVRTYPAARNHHENQILAWSVLPSGVDAKLEARAEKLAASIIEKLGIEGLLCVEMFVTRQGRLLINELAPRPHNSGHLTIDACVTSQFEQQLRAVCELPLGLPTQMRPAAMVNLLGDLWSDGRPNWAAACAHPGVKLHLYGKLDPRPGRKMGHMTALAESVEQALENAISARCALMQRDS
jgi:5-(carboxyamino)imidazole ribonucleotide synthase